MPLRCFALACCLGVLSPPFARAQPTPDAAVASPAPTAAPLHAEERPATRDAVHSVEAGVVLYQLTRPGGQVGYSYRIVETPDRQHALVVGADLGAFVWPQREVGIFLLPRVGWRGRFDVGLQFEVVMRVGLLHSVPASEAYSVDESGRVEGHVSGGYTFVDFGPALGIGWAIRELGLIPFVRAGVVWIAPVFDQYMLRFDLTVGAEVMLP
jgi:hypothetical protein